MLENQLKQLGFSKNEVTVYLALFDLGKCKAGQIIETTSLHRNLVYTALEELEKRSLITKVEKQNVAVFFANDPKSLLDEIEDRRNAAEQVIETLEKKQKKEDYELQVYEGLEGVKKVRNKTLLENNIKGETMYVIGGSKFSTIPEMESYWRSYHKKREKMGMNFKILFDRNTDPEMLLWRNKLPLTDAKYLPFSFETPVQIGVFKSLIDISMPGATPLVFSLRSKEIAEGFKKYFEFFWNQEVVIEEGLLAVKKFFNTLLTELKPGEGYDVLGTSVSQEFAREIDNFFDEYHSARIKKGIHVSMLAFNDFYKSMLGRIKRCGDSDFKFSHIKSYTSSSPTPMQITLYNNKVSLMTLGINPVVIYFTRPELYEGFKVHFDKEWNQDSYVLKGPDVIKNIWLESLETKELRFIGARGYFVDRFPELANEVFARAKNIHGLKWKNVVDSGMRNHRLNKLPWMEAKYNLEYNGNPNVIWLWGEKAAVANWTEHEPVVFITTNKHLVQSYRDYFDLLWNKKK